MIAGQNRISSGSYSPPANTNPVGNTQKSPGLLENLQDKLSFGNLPGTGKVSNGSKWGSGGLLEDLGDILQTPQFAVTGLLGGKNPITAVQQRYSPSEALNIKNPIGGLAADILLDPLNLAAGAGLVSKVGKISKIEKLAKLGAAGEKLGSTGIVMKGIEKVAAPILKKTGIADKITSTIEPVARKVLQGIETPLSAAEKVRASQIAKGGTAVGEKSQQIVEASKPISQVLKEKVGGFPLFKPFVESTPENYRGARAGMEAGISEGSERAVQIGETLTAGFSKAQQQRLSQIMKGSVSISDNEAGLRLVAGMARRTVDSLSQEVVRELEKGGMSEKSSLINTVLNNLGTYMPRMYREFVEDPTKLGDFISGGKSVRIVRDRFMKRKDIPEEVRRQMGEIMEAGFPTAKGIQQMTQAIETSKFFRWVHKNYAVSAAPTRTAEAMAKAGYVLMADTPALGILRKTWLPKAIADDINAIGNVTRIGTNSATQTAELYKKLLGWWKIGKIVYNPAAVSRNFMSNVMLMDLAHYPVMSPDGVKFFYDAIQDYVHKGPDYQMARKVGIIGSGYFNNEIKALLKGFDDAPQGNLFMRAAKTFHQGMGKSYTGAEEISKMAMMKWRMSKGDNAKEAADYAQKWLFDYRDVPPAVSLLRNMPFGYPFITFAYKSIPRMIEASAKNPGDISKYYKTFNHIEQEGRAGEEGMLPDYIKNGLFVKLPFNDSKGNSLYFNMAYIVPWGIIDPNIALPSDPAATFFAAAATGRNPFNDQEIFKETDDGDEKLIKLTNFLYQTLMPTLAPEIPLTGIKGGYSWDKLAASIFRRTDRDGNLRDIPTTLLDVGLGLKAQPIDIQKETVKRSNEYEDRRTEIQRNISNISRDQSLSAEEQASKIEKEVKKIEKQSSLFSERFGPQI